jgi:hypothetical protein
LYWEMLSVSFERDPEYMHQILYFPAAEPRLH